MLFRRRKASLTVLLLLKALREINYVCGDEVETSYFSRPHVCKSKEICDSLYILVLAIRLNRYYLHLACIPIILTYDLSMIYKESSL